MLGVMERIVPAPDADSLSTASFSSVRRDPDAARAAGVVAPDVDLHYAPAVQTPAPLPDDFAWAEPSPEPARGQSILDFDTVEFAVVGPEAPRDAISAPPVEEDDAHERASLRGLLKGLGKKREQREEAPPTDWLGVDGGFDARKAGREIGSWDNFDENDDEDDFGWKGGWAGDDPIGDPEFAVSEAARIRRRVTETVDRELTEKEVWFVATGAEEVGTLGMQALLRDYGEELRDALIISIDGCGAGNLYWASSEGMARRYRASVRLVGLARRVSRETEILIKPRVFKGLSTDATPALARGFKALSILALDDNGVPVNWHWRTDTADALDPLLIDKTAEFVTAMVREA